MDNYEKFQHVKEAIERGIFDGTVNYAIDLLSRTYYLVKYFPNGCVQDYVETLVPLVGGFIGFYFVLRFVVKRFL